MTNNTRDLVSQEFSEIDKARSKYSGITVLHLVLGVIALCSYPDLAHAHFFIGNIGGARGDMIH